MTAPNAPMMPTKPQERGASTTISQRDRRWTDTFFDDYRHTRFPNGRPFTGEREYKSGVSEQSITAGFLQSDLQWGEYFCENPTMGQTPQERAATLASAWSEPRILPGGKQYMQFNYARKRITASILQSCVQCGEYFSENPTRGQMPQQRAATLASAWSAPWILPGGKKYMQFNYASNRIT